MTYIFFQSATCLAIGFFDVSHLATVLGFSMMLCHSCSVDGSTWLNLTAMVPEMSLGTGVIGY